MNKESELEAALAAAQAENIKLTGLAELRRLAFEDELNTSSRATALLSTARATIAALEREKEVAK